ncbi:MAG: protein kinase [Burkholderiaceae bacterium]|jgi:non-specific serine/threonine protein kinase|nr:protein kinase [Burkholderiaceae bacterium]
MTKQNHINGSLAAGNGNQRPRPLAAGYRLDEFELLELIGEGGFGIVYRAYDHSLQREVAVKEYMPSMLAYRVGNNSVHVRSARHASTFQAGLRGFINEARTLAQFNHPALLRVYRFWEANATAYMATQLYKGNTLGSYLEQASAAPLTESWLRGMIGPLLGALETLHASGCCHRDIAPDNIFVQNDGNPVLLDFGAARKSIADLVDEVAVMVKSGYSPIEQYADDSALQQGPWTDLYALGAVLYRAVTGVPPVSAVVRSVEDKHVTLQVQRRKDLSAEFCAAIDRSLMLNAVDRPQTVAEFARMLGMTRMGDIYIDQRAAAWTLATEHDTAPAVAASSAVPFDQSALETLSQPLSNKPASTPSSIFQPQARRIDPRRRDLITILGSLLTVVVVAALGWIGWQALAIKSAENARPPLVTAAAQTAPLESQTPALTNAPAADTVLGAAPEEELAPLPTASEPVAESGPLSATPTEFWPANAASDSDPATNNGESAESTAAFPPDTATTPPPEEATTQPSEEESWRRALNEGTRRAYRSYLRSYPRGLHAREARTALAELNRQMLGSSPTGGAASAGRVIFNVRPWGQIFVDGQSRGVSPPVKSLSLPWGVHSIEIRNGDLPVYRARVVLTDRQNAATIYHEFKEGS